VHGSTVVLFLFLSSVTHWRVMRPKLIDATVVSQEPLLQQQHGAELADRSADCCKPAELSGRHLHQHIPPEDWSVTKAEFLDFVHKARRAWEEEKIPDSVEYPNAGHCTYEIGPSMYQVTEHFIKPITEKVGGMSWALMCNPKGHPCDLFVSHAWSEGLFEFARHLRRAWPWRADHLWCCVLANPQCGTVKELLDVPLDRCPFARALAAASYFVVVPNATSSIYNRLWCVYEISEAMSQDKSIRIPTAEARDVIKCFFLTYGCCIACAFLGAVVSLLRLICFSRRCRLGRGLMTWPLLSTVSLWRPFLDHWLGKWLICTMFFLAGMLNGGMKRLFFFFYSDTDKLVSENDCRKDRGLKDVLDTLLEMPTMPVLLFVFAAAGVYDEVYVRLQEQLRHESVFYAECTDANDAKKIRAAIQGREATIDSAVHTLIKAGSYNASIEEFHAKGFRMRALRFNPGSLVLPLPAAIAMAVTCVWPSNLVVRLLYPLQLLLLGLSWFWYFCCSRGAEAWRCHLLLRRVDQVAWMLAGAHYLLYSYDRWDLTVPELQCVHHPPTVPPNVKHFFTHTQPMMADILRQSFSAPIWFLLPLCDGPWNGADLGLKFSFVVIVAMAFLHWQAIVGRAFVLYHNPGWLISCGSLTVLTKLAVLLRRVCREQEWIYQRVLARRARLLSGLCLILCDVLPHFKQLQELVNWSSQCLVGHRLGDLCVVSTIMGDVMHTLAPLASLLALVDPVWPHQTPFMKETLSLASPSPSVSFFQTETPKGLDEVQPDVLLQQVGDCRHAEP